MKTWSPKPFETARETFQNIYANQTGQEGVHVRQRGYDYYNYQYIVYLYFSTSIFEGRIDARSPTSNP